MLDTTFPVLECLKWFPKVLFWVHIKSNQKQLNLCPYKSYIWYTCSETVVNATVFHTKRVWGHWISPNQLAAGPLLAHAGRVGSSHRPQLLGVPVTGSMVESWDKFSQRKTEESHRASLPVRQWRGLNLNTQQQRSKLRVGGLEIFHDPPGAWRLKLQIQWKLQSHLGTHWATLQCVVATVRSVMGSHEIFWPSRLLSCNVIRPLNASWSNVK